MKPADAPGHEAQRSEILERISHEYGKPEEKQREATKKLGKDEFFKIMVTQMQHQDPLKPYQNEQMAAQMAQFSALEQMVNVNNNLDKLATSQTPLHQLGAANLIGKYVTADSGRMLHTEGKYTDVNFELPTDAAKARIVILNERGENVREIEAKDLKKGSNKIPWDGKRSNNMAATSGQYMVQISASAANDKPIQVLTMRTDIVHGVAFDGKETVLLTGDINKPQKILLRNVSKIVDASNVKKGDAAAPNVVSGLPEGMQIGGLENIIPSQESGEQVVSDITPGNASKYSPIDLAAMRRAQEKPVVDQPLSNDQIRKVIEQGNDLTAANPIAAAIREGKGSVAPRQSVPTSGEGSIAGKLVE